VLKYLGVFVLSNKPFECGHWPVSEQLESLLFTLFRSIKASDAQAGFCAHLFQSKEYAFRKNNEKEVFQVQSQQLFPDSLAKQIRPAVLDCFSILSDLLKSELNISLHETYYSIQASKRPVTPKPEPSIKPLRMITEQSTEVLGRNFRFLYGKSANINTKVAKQSDSSSQNYENLNKFALTRLKVETQSQAEQRSRVFNPRVSNERSSGSSSTRVR